MIHRAQPEKTTVNSKEAEWSLDIMAKWSTHVVPLLEDDEWVSTANYFTPRPWEDEYNRGSPYAGFVYTLQPGDHVCQKQWTP